MKKQLKYLTIAYLCFLAVLSINAIAYGLNCQDCTGSEYIAYLSTVGMFQLVATIFELGIMYYWIREKVWFLEFGTYIIIANVMSMIFAVFILAVLPNIF